MWFTVTTNFGTGEQVSNTTTLRLECNSTAPTTRVCLSLFFSFLSFLLLLGFGVCIHNSLINVLLQSAYEIGSVTYGVNSVFQGWIDQWTKENK